MAENDPRAPRAESTLGKFAERVADPIAIAVEMVSRVFAVLPVGFMPFSISIEPATRSVDKRVARLEDARHALMEGLQAIDELRSEADRNKKDLATALADLNAVKTDKATAERELSAVKEAVSVDVEVFRAIARIPNEAQIKRERLIGFTTGVLASIIASGIWWAGAKLVG